MLGPIPCNIEFECVFYFPKFAAGRKSGQNLLVSGFRKISLETLRQVKSKRIIWRLDRTPDTGHTVGYCPLDTVQCCSFNPPSKVWPGVHRIPCWWIDFGPSCGSRPTAIPLSELVLDRLLAIMALMLQKQLLALRLYPGPMQKTIFIDELISFASLLYVL